MMKNNLSNRLDRFHWILRKYPLGKKLIIEEK